MLRTTTRRISRGALVGLAALAFGVAGTPPPVQAAEEAATVATAASQRAVEAPGLQVVLPGYTFTRRSVGLLRDLPHTDQHALAAGLSAVAPLGRAFGTRVSLLGEWRRRVFHSDLAFPAPHQDRGYIEASGSMFWRSRDRGRVGLGYRLQAQLDDTLDRASLLNEVGLLGELYLGDFDVDATATHQFGTPRSVVYFSAGSGPLEILNFDTEFDAFHSIAGLTWYPSDAWALRLGGLVEVGRERDGSGGVYPLWIDARFKSGGPVLNVSWLPLPRELGWCVLDGRFSYVASTSKLDGYPWRDPLHTYVFGAAVRIVLPRVGSLRELRRAY